MDLNRLYFSHQMDLLRATRGAASERQLRLQSADKTARIIAKFQAGVGATVAPLALMSRLEAIS